MSIVGDPGFCDGPTPFVMYPQPLDRPLQDQSYLPKQQPVVHKAGAKGIRYVTVTQPYWLNMSIPFTSTLSENATAFTDQQNFPLYIRGAWTNMSVTDVLVRVVTTATQQNWSFNQVLIGSIAGRQTLAHPMLYYRRGYALPSQSGLRGDFTNSPTSAMASTSRLIFLCERPREQAVVPVAASADYWIDVSLNLSGGATTTGTARSQQIEKPVLIYGALTNAPVTTTIRVIDTARNISWSSQQLPIGCFAGIDDGTNVQNYIVFPKPYPLQPNSQLLIEWTNVGAASGRFLSFFGEKILRQS